MTDLECYKQANLALKNGNFEGFVQLIEQMEDVHYVETLELYTNGPTVFSQPLLHRAATLGNIDCIEILLDRGADPSHIDAFHKTALDCLLYDNFTCIEKFMRLDEAGGELGVVLQTQQALNSNLHIISGINCLPNLTDALLNSGRYDANVMNAFGETPLHIATRFGNVQIIEVLMSHGANPNIPNNDGVTAHMLVQQTLGNYQHYQTIKDLLGEPIEPLQQAQLIMHLNNNLYHSGVGSEGVDSSDDDDIFIELRRVASF